MKTAYAKYISSLLLFGSNGIVASHILLGSYEIVLTRTFIGSLFLIAAFLFSKGRLQCLKNKNHLAFLAISGASMGASWMFLYEAYAQVGVSVATLTYYCGPVIVMALSPLVFRERVTLPKIFGFAAVFLGMIFLNGTALLRDGFSWGILCGILSALTYALMVIFNKKAESITGLENSMLQLVVSFVVVALFTLLKQGAAISFTMQSVFPILLLGIVNTGVGCYLYFSSIQKLQAQSVAIFGYLEPLSALFFSAIILHERLTLSQLAGAALILGGAALGELFGMGRRRKLAKGKQ